MNETYSFYSDTDCEVASGEIEIVQVYSVVGGSTDIEGALNINYTLQTADLVATADDLVSDLNDDKPCGAALQTFVKDQAQSVVNKSCELLDELKLSFPVAGTAIFSNILVDSGVTPRTIRLGDLDTGAGDSINDRPEEVNSDFLFINSSSTQ